MSWQSFSVVERKQNRVFLGDVQIRDAVLFPTPNIDENDIGVICQFGLNLVRVIARLFENLIICEISVAIELKPDDFAALGTERPFLISSGYKCRVRSNFAN